MQMLESAYKVRIVAERPGHHTLTPSIMHSGIPHPQTRSVSTGLPQLQRERLSTAQEIIREANSRGSGAKVHGSCSVVQQSSLEV